MSRIIFQDTYIIVIPSFSEVEEHSHAMLHLFLGEQPCEIVINEKSVSGNCIFVASDIKHKVEKKNGCKLFFLFDLAGSHGEKIKELYLKENSYCAINQEENLWIPGIEEKSDEEIISFANSVLERLIGSSCEKQEKDDRINLLVERIKQGEYFQKSITEIAQDLYISESRLQHLFKENMGVTLKHYLLIHQMKYSYKLVLEGKSITYAAMEAGFASAAHLAYTCKKSTGISISNVLKK